MKLRILIFTLLLGSLIAVPHVLAQESTPTAEQSTAERCSLAQSYLNTIQRPRDLKTRVDRLQAYRYIYQRMDIFVNRLERNKQPEAQNLRTSLDKFNRLIDSFKNNYEEYDTAREKVASMDNCHSAINTFRAYLEEARVKRAAVHGDVVSIEEVLSQDVKSQLDVLYTELLAAKQGESNE